MRSNEADLLMKKNIDLLTLIISKSPEQSGLFFCNYILADADCSSKELKIRKTNQYPLVPEKPTQYCTPNLRHSNLKPSNSS